jgi:hypothetical protein
MREIVFAWLAISVYLSEHIVFIVLQSCGSNLCFASAQHMHMFNNINEI